MPTNEEILATGLSLDPGGKAQASPIRQKTEEAIDQICNGQREPWLTTLQESAEQREDLVAARRACQCLALYYTGILEGADRKIADYDRCIYYAQCLKDCGPESEGLYHAVYGVALLQQTLGRSSGKYTVDSIQPAVDQFYTAIRAGELWGANYVIVNEDQVCRGFEPCENWGVLYAAYRLRAKDPKFSPIQQEEGAAKATALLQRVLADLDQWKSRMGIIVKYYPKQIEIVWESHPTPEDEAILKEIQSRVSKGIISENPVVKKLDDGMETLKLLLFIASPFIVGGAILILIGWIAGG